jgi:NitT/TauT family transport system permease protein
MTPPRTERRDDRLLFSIGVLLLIAGWEATVRLRWVSPASYAAPSEIAVATFHLFSSRGFLQDMGSTAAKALAGTLIGFPAGVILALAINALGRSQTAAERTLDFIRSIPITALIPIFIGIYGVGDRNTIAIGAFSALLVTSVTVWIGLKHGNQRFSTLVHLYRPSYWKMVTLILLPHALPTLVTALRLAVSSSLVLVVVAEMFVGTRRGIGKVINDMTYSDDRASQYAAVLCAGVLGYLLNVACDWLHHRVLRRYNGGSPS